MRLDWYKSQFVSEHENGDKAGRVAGCPGAYSQNRHLERCAGLKPSAYRVEDRLWPVSGRAIVSDRASSPDASRRQIMREARGSWPELVNKMMDYVN